jgi:hypothetical protein
LSRDAVLLLLQSAHAHVAAAPAYLNLTTAAHSMSPLTAAVGRPAATQGHVLLVLLLPMLQD